MPFSSVALARALKDKFEEGYDIAIAESSRGVEPLFGWYRGTVIQAVEKALSSGKRQIISFYEYVSVYIMPFSEVKKICNPETCFFNVNTEEDYKRALELFMVISDEKEG
jgi:molybdopterin-guanine dinucleotide biosynthesis protein A